jgi:hypothetical protein
MGITNVDTLEIAVNNQFCAVVYYKIHMEALLHGRYCFSHSTFVIVYLSSPDLHLVVMGIHN